MLKRSINNYKVLHVNFCVKDMIALVFMATPKE